MNSFDYQKQINTIEKEIADLYKKIANESQKEADRNERIDTINRSINQNTSFSTLQSKNQQMQGYLRANVNSKKKIAEYQKKISAKNIELGRKKRDLIKSEENERKKIQRDQLDFIRQFQLDIEQHKAQLNSLMYSTYSSGSQTSANKSLENVKEYDFFISHASEDKDEIVRELADALKLEGMRVWYDEFELKIGDSLRKKIDAGLTCSRFGVVIISPSFVSKNWTEYELNGMVAKEMDGHKVILPIWHKISKNEVIKFSPTFADKMALNTSIHSTDEIVAKLKELL